MWRRLGYPLSNPLIRAACIERRPASTQGVRMVSSAIVSADELVTNSGDTAWVLASAALVLLMTPGVAFFYGGMVRAKSVLNMLMMSFITIGIVSILWTLFGYSMAFGNEGNKLFGSWEFVGLGELINDPVSFNGGPYLIPGLAFAMFQLMFAIITPALVSGAIADRAKFLGWAVFVAVWVTLVYFPVAHWVFDFGGQELGDGTEGWLTSLKIGESTGVLDFAGGTAVHINAGAAGLALALVLGKRHGWPKTPMKPHSLPLVLLGAGLLWFGWFGFNAGSALGANGVAAVAFTNTQVATGAAVIGWLIVERMRDGHPTSLGAASGAVAGLVAITPACAFVAPWGAVVIGLVAGALCALAVGLKFRFGFDDSLDVVGVHLVGGLVGCLMIGLVGTVGANPLGRNGIFTGGDFSALTIQAAGAVAVMVYSFVMTAIIGLAIDKTIGFRITQDDEISGIDLAEHAETGYDLSPATSGGFRSGTVAPSAKEEVSA
jgi:Amt family ammonium transporter